MIFLGNGMEELDPFGESKSRKSSGFSEGHSGKSRQFSGYCNDGHYVDKSRNCSGNSNGFQSAPVSIPPPGQVGAAGSSGTSPQQTPPNNSGMLSQNQQASNGMFGQINQLGLVDLTTPTKAIPQVINLKECDQIFL